MALKMTAIDTIYVSAGPPMSRTDGRTLRAQHTRARIVRAARDLLMTSGYYPKIADIAEMAEVAPRTIFEHFQSLPSLMRQALSSDERKRIADKLRALPDDELLTQMIRGRMPGKF